MKITFFLGLAHPPQTKSILSSLGRRDPIEAKGFENSKQFGSLALPLHKASLGISCLRELRSFASGSIRILTGGAELRITKCWAPFMAKIEGSLTQWFPNLPCPLESPG